MVAAPSKHPSLRRPKETVLWQVVHENLPRLVEYYHQHDRVLPAFIERELESFLACGLPEYGVTHLKCTVCGHSQVTPFSCKCRGLCPSCAGRRMNQTAKNLVDHALPHVPIRQWVITFPPPLRFLLAHDAQLCTQVLTIFVREVFASYAWTAHQALNVDPKSTRCGSVTAIQRVGSALQSTLHFHLLALDGVYLDEGHDDQPCFAATPPPSKGDIAQVAWSTCLKTTEMLQARGQYLASDSDNDLWAEKHPLLARSIEASIQSLVAIGPRAGQSVLRLAAGPRHTDASQVPSQTPGHGYNLHAGTRVPAHDRKRLERLCRYILRPAISHDRLSRTHDGKVVYRLKRPWSDGTRAVAFTPLDFLSRLMAIIPPARSHQIRLHGVLARRSKLRRVIAPEPPRRRLHRKVEQLSLLDKRGRKDSASQGGRWIPRAELLAHVFGEDVERCSECGRGKMEVVAVLTRPEAIHAVLLAMGFNDESLGCHFARGPPEQQQLSFDFASRHEDAA